MSKPSNNNYRRGGRTARRNGWRDVAILFAAVVGLAGSVSVLSAQAAVPPSGQLTNGLNRCLENSGSQAVNGNLVRQYACNPAAAGQNWTLMSDATIRAQGLCLDARNSAKTAGTLIQVSTCQGKLSQKWRVSGDLLVNNNANLCLDTKNNTAADATTIQLNTCTGVAGQHWLLTGGTTTRDPLKRPFASNSIWNTPVGSAAQYVAANLPALPNGSTTARTPMSDADNIIMKPDAPLTPIKYNGAVWGGPYSGSRCTANEDRDLALVPIPADYVNPETNRNESTAILSADARTVVQTQPFHRCTAGGPATSSFMYPSADLYGDGIPGAHGGSGMSSLGGTIRVGELRPGQYVRHALKVNIHGKSEFYNCSQADRSDCYRWPARKADSAAVTSYGSLNNNQNTAMKMGALLAIPSNVNVDSLGLSTLPAKQLAWTLQNYGAYVVDDTASPEFAIETEQGPDGKFIDQFKTDYGYDFEQRATTGSAWTKDIQKLRTYLSVVNNNAADNIGGGGTPRQPLTTPLVEPQQ